MSRQPQAHVVTLGCARNDVDSDELAGRLIADGWGLAEAPENADVVLVNTCGFIDAAKSDSIAAILELAGSVPVVATGCMAERYGQQLADELPEAAAVLGFDQYPVIGSVLRTVLAGGEVRSHAPADRRTLLPVTPVLRHDAAVVAPGHGGVPRGPGGTASLVRHRLQGGPVAALKIASGCDRRCSFCAIPSFRGANVSRPPQDILAEARALVASGAVELVLVSENSTAYGKDLPGSGGLAALLHRLAEVDGLARVRASYLQPAEIRPDLLDAMAGGIVAPYYDISFQHSDPRVLRRMRRFGHADAFLDLIGQVRSRVPRAGIRTNVIVGFPGETSENFEGLLAFMEDAAFDAVGVFGYSDEEGTEAVELPGKVDADEIAARVAQACEAADRVATAAALRRIGEQVEVLAEGVASGRAGHQGPQDGSCVWRGRPAPSVGTLVPAEVVGCAGADLLVSPVGRS